LRIKSYFDSSIQTAMRQARHEFGEGVMLVSSRVASPGFRYLGHFEVIFAVDDNETGPNAENSPRPDQPTALFEELYRKQLASAVVPAGSSREATVGAIYALLVDLGIELAVAESLVALIRSCSPCLADQQTSTHCTQEPILLSSTRAPHEHKTVPLIAEHAQDWPEDSMRDSDSGGAKPDGQCLLEETSLTSNPPMSAWMNSTIASDGFRPSAPLPSRIASIESVARSAMHEQSGRMPSDGERAALFPTTGQEVSARLPMVGSSSTSGAVDALVTALGTYGITRRSGS